MWSRLLAGAANVRRQLSAMLMRVDKPGAGARSRIRPRPTAVVVVTVIASLLAACTTSGSIGVESTSPSATPTPVDTAAHPPLWAHHPGLSGTSTVAQYDVRAATLTSAFDVLHRIAPALLQRPPGTRLSATTNYRVSSNPCAAGPVTVTLTQTITLPRWVYPAATDAASIAQWVRFRTMLDRHEAGHAAVNTRAALIINPLTSAQAYQRMALSCGAAADSQRMVTTAGRAGSFNAPVRRRAAAGHTTRFTHSSPTRML